MIKVINLFLLLSLVSCKKNYIDEIENAIGNLEFIDMQMDEYGVRNIPTYKQTIFVSSISAESNDSIKLSESEFRELQQEIYDVRLALEDIQDEMIKEYETE